MIKKLWLLLLFVLLVAVIAGIIGLMPKKVQIATEGAYPPWNFKKDGELTGFEVELGEAICETLLYKCKFVEEEWADMVAGLQSGKYDFVMSGLVITPETEAQISFSDIYFPAERLRFIGAKQSAYPFESLQGLRIGVLEDAAQVEVVTEKYGASNEIVTFSSPLRLEKGLTTAKVDLIMVEQSAFRGAANRLDGYMVQGPELLLNGGIAIGMQKSDARLEEINSALASLRESGKLNELTQKYFNQSQP